MCFGARFDPSIAASRVFGGAPLLWRGRYKAACKGNLVFEGKSALTLAPMTAQQIQRQLKEALALHHAGKLAQAQIGYEAVLAADPQNAEALRLLGVVLTALGDANGALALFQRAVAAKHAFPEAWYSLGNVLQGLGRSDEALAAYAKALALRPVFPELHCNQGILLASLGRTKEAEDCYRRALTQEPRHLVTLSRYSQLLRGKGRHAEALSLAQRMVKTAPQMADTHNVLGLCLRAAGQVNEAAQCFLRALQLDPGFAEGYCNFGAMLLDNGKAADALSIFEAALNIRPTYVEALLGAGNTLLALRRPADAEQYFKRILAGEGGHALAHNNLGVLHLEQGRRIEAETAFRLSLKLQPAAPDTLGNLGRCLQLQGRLTEAEELLRRALELQPDHAEALNNLAIVLNLQGRLPEAEALLRKLLALRPNHVDAHTNLGNILLLGCRCAEAVAEYETALRLQPASIFTRFNLGAALLLNGDFARGLPEYEARLLEDPARVARHAHRPRWDGRSSLEGKTLMLFAEQGLGDTLQFLRYVPLLKSRGARVLLEVQAPLLPLLAGWPGVEAVFEQGASLPDYDFQCPFLSLPLVMGTRLNSIPALGPVFSIPEIKEAEWQRRLAKHGPGRRVGLVWSGNPKHQNDHNRSLPLSSLGGVLRQPGLRFFSLQKEKRPGDAGLLSTYPSVVDLGPELGDFCDTAAVLRCLDLVVTVDTSVAHLSATLGRPTWLLISYSPDWRWMLGREDSPWYPSVRLFRQASHGDWAGVLARVQVELSRFVQA